MADKIIFEVVATAKGVKVVQQQTDKLAKSTDKADGSTKKLTKSRDAYHRKEKGAAQISSNSTKNFSKMQQGIDGGGGSGGLVRAYALLAANVFALTAAFGVLSRSAQIDTLTQSMEILSTTGGTYIKNLARDMQEASGFAIDLAQAFSQVSLASSAGLSTKEIEGLTAVAKGAAISLGRNLPDAMDRIFRGAIKLEPEILDEIGLFVRVDEAAQKYARNNNKVVSSLTQVEKRQAFLNEILEQGTKKFSEYAEGIKPDPYVRIGAALGDIAQSGLHLINSVLGPLLSFLAESKTILSLVFGVLVFSLVKKAIPALGQFNMNLAANAKAAADNAREYTAGIKATTSAQVQENNKKLQDQIDTTEKLRKATGRTKGRPGQSPEAKATMKALKKETTAEKRLGHLRDRELQLEKQIKGSKEKQAKLLKEDLKNMRVELKNLEKQEKLTAKIADNTKRGQIDPKKGSVSQRRQEKLDQKAAGSTIIAGAAGVTESQGMKAGFSELNKGLKDSGKKLGTFGKAATYAKGSVSILGSGLSRVMMMLGPWMMAFTMLSPLLIAFGKWAGFGSEEASKLGSTITKVTDQTEKLSERFEHQVKASRNVDLTFREQNKAMLAFSRAQLETTSNIHTLAIELRAFKAQLGFVTGAWESFKSIINMDEESKVIALQIKSMKAQLETALEVGDADKLSMMAKGGKDSGGIEGVAEYLEADKLLIASKQKVWETQLGVELSEAKIGRKKVTRTFDMLATQAKIIGGIDQTKESSDTYIKSLGSLNDSEKAYLIALVDTNKARKVRDESIDGEKINQANLIKNTKDQIELDQKRVNVYASMESTLEGAQESISKFQQSFQITTKVDDVVASFSQLEGSLKGLDTLTDQGRKDFFEAFKDKDNPFNKLFKDTGDTQKEYQARIKEIREDLDDFRTTTITAASANQRLGREIKNLNSIFKSGMVEGIDITKKQTTVAQNKFKIEKANTAALIISKGITKETFDKNKEAFELAVDREAKEQSLLDMGLDRVVIDQISGQLDKEAAVALDAKIAKATELLTGKEMELKLSEQIFQKEKELANLKITAVENEAKLLQLRKTGKTDLSPVGEAAIKIDAARVEMNMTIKGAQIKKSLLDIEAQILKARLVAIDADLKLAGKKGLNLIAMNQQIDNSMLFGGQVLDQQIENAKTKFQLAISESTSTGFQSGLVEGVMAGAIQYAAIDKAHEDARLAEKKKNAQEFFDWEDIARADKKTDEKFDDMSEGGLGAKNQADKDAASMQMFRGSMEAQAESLKKLGPEGELVASVVQGAFAISDAYVAMGTAVENGADKTAAGLAFAAQAIGQIGSMLAANSKMQVAEVDKQIEAEKKRDGKSKESIAKIKAMEAKKEAIKKKAFDTDKKMKMAQVVMSTAAAIMQTLATGGYLAIPLAIMIGAMGAAQLAIISKSKYSGGDATVDKPAMGALTIGKRDNKVDVSRGASGGEMSYLRGGRGVGSNANDFRPTGGAYGMRSYAAKGEGILVGEQGPEVVTPTQPVDVLATGTNGGAQNVNFTINTIDSQGVADFLDTNQGAIIQTIRGAANGYGTGFLEEVDTTVLAPGG